MNKLIFSGRLAAAPVLQGSGDSAVAKLTLISNRFAGKDGEGQAKTEAVSIQFTAFRGKAETIARHCMKGDQLILCAYITNNNWTDKQEAEHYGFNFIVDDFEFGAPGSAKREALADQQ